MKCAALAALLLAGCFDPHYDAPTCGPAGECPSGLRCESGVCRTGVIVGNADADPNAPDARVLTDGPLLVDGPNACLSWSFTPSNTPCTGANGSITIATSQTYDVDGTAFNGVPTTTFAQGTNAVTLVSLDAFTINTGVTLTLTGTHPLVILVHGQAIINGTLKLAAVMSTDAPGGDAGGCSTGGPGTTSGGTGGGGGGGGFGTLGIMGGAGTSASAPGAGGAAVSATTLSPLHGGCQGGAGSARALGGGSGGAVQISARDGITVAGTIDASGGGGAGGAFSSTGAGGGGSGGGILLEAPTVGVTGSLCADGGAGGEGAGGNIAGNPGESGKCQGVAIPGAGATNGGGDGGAGSYTTNQATAGFNGAGAAGGGGGGGAGGGVIRLRGSVSGTPVIITPPSTTVPL